MTNFKYRLEPYKGMNTRYTCPQCGKKKNFARYITVDGEYLGDDVGRCNSELSCAYHKVPEGDVVVSDKVFKYEKKEPSFLKQEDVYSEKYTDTLFDFLITKFNVEDVMEVYDRYEVRSSDSKWRKSTVFYQKDLQGRYRTGKIILYNDSGKRVKHPYSHIYWQHNFSLEEFNLNQCLFGEHLLETFNVDGRNIYLVESEKTCIIASLFYKEDLFLASGGLTNLNPAKLEVLKGYDVEAVPDKGGYDIWKGKLEPLGITVNTVMEEADIEDGSDIADLLLQ